MIFFDVVIQGKSYKVLKEKVGSTTWVSFNGWTFKQELPFGKRYKVDSQSGGMSSNEIYSPMPGQLIKLLVHPGEEVKKGQTLAVLEAMKMEHSLKASEDGVVEKVFFSEGDSLQLDDLIIKLEDKLADQDKDSEDEKN